MNLISCRNIEEYILKIELLHKEVTGIDIQKEKTLNSDEFLICIKQIKQNISKTRDIQEKRNELSLKCQKSSGNVANAEIIKYTEDIKQRISNLFTELQQVDQIIARQIKQNKFDDTIIARKKKVRKDVEKIIQYIKKSEDEVLPSYNNIQKAKLYNDYSYGNI